MFDKRLKASLFCIIKVVTQVSSLKLQNLRSHCQWAIGLVKIMTLSQEKNKKNDSHFNFLRQISVCSGVIANNLLTKRHFLLAAHFLHHFHLILSLILFKVIRFLNADRTIGLCLAKLVIQIIQNLYERAQKKSF